MSPRDDEELRYVCLNKNNFEHFARDLLLVKNYRVEVYVNQGAKSTSKWEIKYRGSPGNLIQFEDLIFNNTEVISNATTIGVNVKRVNNQLVSLKIEFLLISLINNSITFFRILVLQPSI